MDALVITDLKKRYAGGSPGEGTQALSGVSLTIPAGELFALILALLGVNIYFLKKGLGLKQ